MSNELDTFGKFLMKHFRDRAISNVETLIAGEFKAPSVQSLQAAIQTMDSDQKEIIKRACINSLDSGLHDFLFALQEATDNNQNIKVIAEGENVAELSDGLQGELFTEDGWFSKFSEYGEEN